jgi:hypothetical protein
MTEPVARFVYGEDANTAYTNLLRQRLMNASHLELNDAASHFDYVDYNDSHGGTRKAQYSREMHQRQRRILIEALGSKYADMFPQVRYTGAPADDVLRKALERRERKEPFEIDGHDAEKLKALGEDAYMLVHNFTRIILHDQQRMPQLVFASIANARMQKRGDIQMFDRYHDFVPGDLSNKQFIGGVGLLIDKELYRKLLFQVPAADQYQYIQTSLMLDKRLGVDLIKTILESDGFAATSDDPLAPVKTLRAVQSHVNDSLMVPEANDLFAAYQKRIDQFYQGTEPLKSTNADAQSMLRVLRSPERGPYILELIKRNAMYVPRSQNAQEFMVGFNSGMRDLYKPWVEHIRRLEAAGKGQQQYMEKMLVHLLARGYPETVVASLLSSGAMDTLDEKKPDAFWNVFGRVYDTAGNMKSLKTLDITQAGAYAELLYFLDRSNFQDVAEEMMKSLDLGAFDVRMDQAVQQRAMPGLIEQVVEFGNQTRPSVIFPLLDRLSTKHSEVMTSWVEGLAPDHEHIALTPTTIKDVWALLQFSKAEYSRGISNQVVETNLAGRGPVTITIAPGLFDGIQDIQTWGYMHSLIQYVSEMRPTMRDLSFQFKIDGVESGKASLEAAKAGVASVDVLKLLKLQTKDFPPASVVERIRSVLNATSRQEGDKMVITIGAQYLEGKDSIQSLDDLIKFGLSWTQYSRSLKGSNKDIAGIYQLVANFALGKAAGILEQKKIPTKTLEQYAPILQEYGFTVNVRESRPYKFFSRFWNDPIGVTSKGMRSVIGARATEIRLYGEAPYGSEMHEGVKATYTCVNARTCAPETADMILLKADPHFVEVSLFAERSGSVNRDRIQTERAGRMVMTFPVTFTSGPRKLTDLAAFQGEMVSWLLKVDGNDGMVMATTDGRMGILNKQEMPVSELRTLLLGERPHDRDQGIKYDERAKRFDSLVGSREQLHITRSFEDFQLFVTMVQRYSLSLQTNMLLLNNGESTPVGSDSLDSRRLLLTFPDGSIGVLTSFTQAKKISTNDAVSLAKKLGASRAVYCDTGMYDFAQIFDVQGKEHTVGWADNKDSTNLGVIAARKRK